MGVWCKYIFYVFVAYIFKCQNMFILAVLFVESNKNVKQTQCYIYNCLYQTLNVWDSLLSLFPIFWIFLFS